MPRDGSELRDFIRVQEGVRGTAERSADIKGNDEFPLRARITVAGNVHGGGRQRTGCEIVYRFKYCTRPGHTFHFEVEVKGGQREPITRLTWTPEQPIRPTTRRRRLKGPSCYTGEIGCLPVGETLNLLQSLIRYPDDIAFNNNISDLSRRPQAILRGPPVWPRRRFGCDSEMALQFSHLSTSLSPGVTGI